MRMKILFLVLVFVLLSSAVFAADVAEMDKPVSGGGASEAPEPEAPKVLAEARSEPADSGSKVEIKVTETEKHETTGGEGDDEKVYKLPDVVVRAPKKSPAEAPEKAPEKLKVPPKKPLKVAGVKKQTIPERGLYSFYDFVGAYDDFSGLAKYGILFYGEEGLIERRQMAAEYFCERALGIIGGKACWQSRLCEPAYNRKDMPVGRSVMVAQQGIGGFLPAVSVQGEKSLPIAYKEAGKSKRKYVYRITYSIANPDTSRSLQYTVRLVGDVHTWESDAFAIKPAEEGRIFRDDRLGNNPFVTEGEFDYRTVCLHFSPRMRTSNWNYVSELCAPLVQYEGAASRPYAGGAS